MSATISNDLTEQYGPPASAKMTGWQVPQVLWNELTGALAPPGYDPAEPTYQKVLDIGAMPARAIAYPAIAASEGAKAAAGPDWEHLPPSALHAATGTALSMLGEGGVLGSPEGGIAAFPVWHGSGHKFEPTPEAPFGRFDPSKVDTGEGTQMEGWGMYWGRAFGTGEYYKGMGLPEDRPFMKGQIKIGDMHVDQDAYDDMAELPIHHRGQLEALRYYDLHNGNADQAAVHLRDAAPRQERVGYRDTATAYRDGADWLDANKHRLSWQPHSQGHMYQGWIHPEHEEFLDWDKKWSDQQPGVQEKLLKLFPGGVHEGEPFYDLTSSRMTLMPGGKMDVTNWTGRQLYSALDQRLGSARATSEALDAAGIPGNTYLDHSTEYLPRVWHHDGDPVTVDGDDRFSEEPSLRVKADLMDNSPPHMHQHSTEPTMSRNEVIDDLRQHYQDRLEQAKADNDWTAEHQHNENLNWLNNNEHKLSLEDNKNEVRNYVIFHPRHVSVFDRDGQAHGLRRVNQDPFTGEFITERGSRTWWPGAKSP